MRQRMRLYEILADRISVNMLKILYDREYVAKTAHTLPFLRLNALLGGKLTLEQVLKIENYGLLTAEKVEDMFILSLNKKGKEFIEQLDKLKKLIEEEETREEKKFFKIEYDLTELDQKLLVLCYKICNEQGVGISLDSLTHEMYPANPSSRKGVVSRYLNKLVKLNLVKKTKEGKGFIFEVTNSGERVIKNQLMESLV